MRVNDMSPILPELGEIRSLRKRMGMSQDELAKRVGVTQSHIAKIERGKIDPSYSLVRKILLALEEERKDPCFRYMSSPILCAQDDEIIEDAVLLMKERGYSQVVVLRGLKVIGLIREEDVLIQKKRLSELRAKEVMSSPPPTVPGEASRSAIEGLVLHLGAVVVLRGEEPVGIITRSDLIGRSMPDTHSSPTPQYKLMNESQTEQATDDDLKNYHDKISEPERAEKELPDDL